VQKKPRIFSIPFNVPGKREVSCPYSTPSLRIMIIIMIGVENQVKI